MTEVQHEAPLVVGKEETEDEDEDDMYSSDEDSRCSSPLWTGPERWRCRDEECRFSCLDAVKFDDFAGVDNLCMLEWAVTHQISSATCNRDGCTGTCKPVVVPAAEECLNLKCTKCLKVSRGAKRGIWTKARMPYTPMIAIVFSIIGGFNTNTLVETVGVNRNTVSLYTKRVGTFLKEVNKQNGVSVESLYRRGLRDLVKNKHARVPIKNNFILAIIMWRVNLTERKEEEGLSYFQYFCEDLRRWTRENPYWSAPE